MKQPKSLLAGKVKTVDSEHRNYCNNFESACSELHEFQLRKKAVKLQIKSIETNEIKDWCELVRLKDELLELQDSLKKTKETNDEMGYYMNTAPILFKYYDTFENTNDEDGERGSSAATTSSSSGKSILSFFSKNKEQSLVPEEAPKENRGSLYERYMEIVDDNYIKEFPEVDETVCTHCKNQSKCFISNEGLAYCTVCCTTERVLLEVEKPSYKEPPTEVTYYNYRRINHFNEWLSQIQAREFTDIPNDVIDNVLVELKKQKINNMATLTPQKVRDILRKLKINKYYEHVPYLMYKLTGIPPVRLGEELEEKLRHMFFAIQAPFLKHAPTWRKNFLSYSFVLHKCLQLLGKTELSSMFLLLKSRDKLWQQEMIWKKICEELQWPFHRSI